MNIPGPAKLNFFSKIANPSMVSSLFVFGCLTIFSGLSCIFGTFYDDEIFSIRWAALSFSNIFDYVRYINSHDIHPPASYLLNKFAFEALGNWKAVQFVNGTLNAAAIAWFHRCTVDKVATRERLALTFVLATAVTSEMWGTGLRWNAYFNPVFLVLYTVALLKRPSVTARAAVLGIGTVFLFHTAYLTIVAAPVLWGTFLARSLHNLRPSCVARIALILFAVVIACLPQLYVMVTVHLPSYAGSHSYSVLYSIAQSISTLALGTAVFPIDYVPALFLLGLTATAVSSLKSILHDEYFAVLFGGTLLGFILLIITRLGIEGRNAVFLYPIALTLIVLAISRSASWIRFPAMVSLVLFQIVSVYGFVFHHDTAKGSFNTPFAQTMREISKTRSACQGRAYIFTHDPVLTYLMQKAGENVSSPYASSDTKIFFVHERDCVFVVRTYRGSILPALLAQYDNQLIPESFRKTQTINLGYDRFHAIKSWLGNEPFPDYYIAIEVYDVLHDASVPDWFSLSYTQ